MNTLKKHILRHAEPAAEGNGAASAPEKGRKVKMDDGRELVFGEKQRIQKDYGVEGENVWARIDFENGKIVQVFLPGGSLVALSQGDTPEALIAATSLRSMGHGLVQKLGDAAAGAETTDDALEAILEVAKRVARGEWKKVSEGGGSAKGAGLLVTAMHEYLQATTDPNIQKDQVRDMLSQLTPQEKAGLTKLDPVAEIIERLKAERSPTKKEQEAKQVSAKLVDAMAAALKAGQKFEKPAEPQAPAETEQQPATA